MASLKVNLNPQSIEKVIYVGAKSQENANSLANLDTKHSSTDISKSAAKRYTKYMNAFCEMVRYARHKASSVMSSYSVYISFITLTLPEEQKETDKESKRNLLNYLIITLKRKYNVVNYCWRAETQANGNIHYHIMADRYINKKELREVWEKILILNGYEIDNQASNGYKSFSTWVIGAKDPEAIRKYMTKYMTKTAKTTDSEREDYEEPSRRGVEGRKIGCSDSMRKIESFYQMNVTELIDFVLIIQGFGIIKENKQEYFSAYYIDYQSVKEKKGDIDKYVKNRRIKTKKDTFYKKFVELPDLLQAFAPNLYENVTTWYGEQFINIYA